MVKLDRENEFIPLTFDGMFKGLFKNDKAIFEDWEMEKLNGYIFNI